MKKVVSLATVITATLLTGCGGVDKVTVGDLHDNSNSFGTIHITGVNRDIDTIRVYSAEDDSPPYIRFLEAQADPEAETFNQVVVDVKNLGLLAKGIRAAADFSQPFGKIDYSTKLGGCSQYAEQCSNFYNFELTRSYGAVVLSNGMNGKNFRMSATFTKDEAIALAALLTKAHNEL